MSNKEILLLIDPQEDFCEEKDGVGGKLAVPGGREALENVAGFINRHGHRLDDIIVTLDSHHAMHIAHPMWLMVDGKPIDPFTTVMEDNGQIVIGNLDDTGQFHQTGTATTRHPKLHQWTVEYLRKLSEGGRYPHMVWTEHCLIGTPGQNMTKPIRDAVLNWERTRCAVAPKITKGSDIKVEHFGALKAEVVNPDNPETGINSYFLGLLSDPDATIYIAGLARGHCLANTARDTAEEFDGDTFCRRVVLLEDGTADVANLEFLGDSFVSDFTARGMKTAKTTDF